jgi:hypothetical protein
MMKRNLMASAALALCAAFAGSASAAPPSVETTWTSIASRYSKIGDKRILMDGYISRESADSEAPARVREVRFAAGNQVKRLSLMGRQQRSA